MGYPTVSLLAPCLLAHRAISTPPPDGFGVSNLVYYPNSRGGSRGGLLVLRIALPPEMG